MEDTGDGDHSDEETKSNAVRFAEELEAQEALPPSPALGRARSDGPRSGGSGVPADDMRLVQSQGAGSPKRTFRRSATAGATQPGPTKML